MIQLYNVSVRYKDGTMGISNVTVSVDDGEFVFVVGPTGSGKTTFLKTLYREETPCEGVVTVAGRNISRIRHRDIPYLRRHIGVVFQDFRLLPQKTAWENVAFALHVTGAPGSIIRKRVSAALEMVGLTGKERSFPGQLSGGEQQRVSIARALVNSPALLLADEPTGNLDPTTSEDIFTLLDYINKRGTTIIVATHDAATVDRMQKRVLTFEQGRILRDDITGGYSGQATQEQTDAPS